jgi:hypothetical protein
MMVDSLWYLRRKSVAVILFALIRRITFGTFSVHYYGGGGRSRAGSIKLPTVQLPNSPLGWCHV